MEFSLNHKNNNIDITGHANPVMVDGKPLVLSYSRVSTFQKDRSRYYMSYKLGVRDPQNIYMAIGSVFDIIAKHRVLGQVLTDDEVVAKLDANRSYDPGEALIYGKAVWNIYESTGQFSELMSTLEDADMFSVTGDYTLNVGGLMIRGLPDLWYVKNGMTTVLDWKVNGVMKPGSAKRNAGCMYYIEDKGKQYINDGQRPAPAAVYAAQLDVYRNLMNRLLPESRCDVGVISQFYYPWYAHYVYRIEACPSFWDSAQACWDAEINGTIISPERKAELDGMVKMFGQGALAMV